MRIVATLLGPLCLISVTCNAEQSYSPHAYRSHPINVYWGDTHLHTNMSIDANFGGNNLLTPADAYRFAKGETITNNNGTRMRRLRPLDFLVIADHAANLGLMLRLKNSDSELQKTKQGRRLLARLREMQANSGTTESFPTIFFQSVFRKPAEQIKDEWYRRSVWHEVTANADANNAPGRFTAFIGHEWTSDGPNPAIKGNLHRVVIFKDDASKVNQILPLTRFDSRDPEVLWRYLEDYQRLTGGEVLAIPHNGNLSNGEAFVTHDFGGRPLSRAYAETRSRWEPLYEVTQIKGDSETHPMVSPTDEFADYETWNSPFGIDMATGKERDENEPNKIPYEYARPALRRGLAQQAALAANPFKFGLIGSTDAHTSLSTINEREFWAQFPSTQPADTKLCAADWCWRANAAGLAAIWAVANTREALFAAMKRRETFATTGTRVKVRFFGGWEFAGDDAFRPDLAAIGYAKGVPMGGDLTNAPKGKAPAFLVRAVKDPSGANLDRIQLIKGWLDATGKTHERIYNVALSDGRLPGPDGSAPSVGSTVDVAAASYTNTIGDPELAVVWLDPDFDPEELAFYYIRVLEIPTPRWTAYDAKSGYFDQSDVPDGIPMITQERAYTSPIWYTP